MTYLLDTNVVSELIKRTGEPSVMEWLEKQPPDSLFLSVLTLGEISKGCRRLPEGKRRSSLEQRVELELKPWFEDRLLPISLSVAERWGSMLAKEDRTRPTTDSLLTATALEHGLALVTRNVKDFDYPSLNVVNPWENR